MPADAEIRAVAGLIYSEMLEDLILSTAIAAHREIKRGRVVCGTCGTKCRAHLPLIPASSTLPGHLQSDSQPPSRTSSPQPSHPTALGVQSNGESSRHGGHTVGPEKGTGGNTGIGSGSGRMDASGNVFFDCLVCSRAISSNRYAPHLSSCLGLNGSTRRGAARSAAVKARMGNGDRSSPSPYLGSVAGSDNGDSDVDSVSGKKAKKPINGNGKRGRSPQKSTPLSTKKSKLSGSVTPLGANLSRGSLPPSKLGRPPTVGSSVHNSSPVNSPSPEFSIISSQSTAVGGKGTTGRKSLPGMPLEMGPESADEDPSYANGGSSSEEADDY